MLELAGNGFNIQTGHHVVLKQLKEKLLIALFEIAVTKRSSKLKCKETDATAETRNILQSNGKF